MRQEVWVTEEGNYMVYEYGGHRHGQYYVSMMIPTDRSVTLMSLFKCNSTIGDYEVANATYSDKDGCFIKDGIYQGVADMGRQLLAGRHDLAGLHTLADFAQDLSRLIPYAS